MKNAGKDAGATKRKSPDQVGAHCSMENILQASHGFVKTKISMILKGTR